MVRWRNESIEIEAEIFTDENKDQVYQWAKSKQMNVYPSFDDDGKPTLVIPTLHKEVTASLGDYIIVKPYPINWNRLYPYKPNIFLATHKKVVD